MTPRRVCPADQCGGGFETSPGPCFDDPDNTFELVPFDQSVDLGGATFTMPPPPSADNAPNGLGAAIATPTQVNVYSSIIYNNTVASAAQVLSFDVYVCVPDGTTDEAAIASTLFDTLIEVDLLDAVGNTTATLFTATFENTINDTTLGCLWNRVSSPVGQLLPINSPFKVRWPAWLSEKRVATGRRGPMRQAWVVAHASAAHL